MINANSRHTSTLIGKSTLNPTREYIKIEKNLPSVDRMGEV